jgi:hypothetical protein
MPRVSPDRPRMIAQTVRFTPFGHNLVEQRARAEGIGVSQYVREAAMLRCAMEIAHEGEDPNAAVLHAFQGLMEDLEARGKRRL